MSVKAESVYGDDSPSRSVSFIQQFDKSFTKTVYLPSLRPKTSFITSQIEIINALSEEYSTKTGARAVSPLQAVNSMSRSVKLLQRMVYIIDKMLNTKMGLLEKKYHKTSLVPWISHFERFLTHLIGIFNDRIALFYRSSASEVSLCSLFQDICDVSASLNKLLVVFVPRPARSGGTDTGSSSTPRSFRTSGYGGSTMIPILKLLTSKIKAVLFRIFAPLQSRIEALVSQRVATAMSGIEAQLLCATSFVTSSRCISFGKSSRAHQLAASISSSILEPHLAAVKCLCRSPGSERLLTAAVNTLLEHLLLYLRTSKCRFSEVGVNLLHSQLQVLVNWVASRAKTELGIPPSVPLILDKAPWHRANAILQVQWSCGKVILSE